MIQEFSFTIPETGSCAFDCVIHPSEMVGTLVVEEGAPIPGGDESAVEDDPASDEPRQDQSRAAAEGADE